MKKFDQEKCRSMINKLRKYAKDGSRLWPDEAYEAADMLENLMMAVYGIQERLIDDE